MAQTFSQFVSFERQKRGNVPISDLRKEFEAKQAGQSIPEPTSIQPQEEQPTTVEPEPVEPSETDAAAEARKRTQQQSGATAPIFIPERQRREIEAGVQSGSFDGVDQRDRAERTIESSTSAINQAVSNMESASAKIQEIQNNANLSPERKQQLIDEQNEIIRQNQSNAQIALGNLNEAEDIVFRSLTAAERAERGLPQREGTNAAIRDALAQFGVTETGEAAEPELTFGDTLAQEVAQAPAGAFDIEAAIAAQPNLPGQPATKLGFDIFAQEQTIARPTDPGPNASASAKAAFERAMAVFRENDKLAKERNAAIEARLGTEANLGAELDKLRTDNQKFRAQLNADLGLEGFDETITGLENNFGILLDREDSNIKKSLADLAEARKTGVLNEEEFKLQLDNFVLNNAQPMENLIAESDEDIIEGPLPEGTTAAEVAVIDAAAETSVASAHTTVGVSGEKTYTDPSTGTDFVLKKNEPVIDLTRYTPEELAQLSGPQIAAAELALTTEQVTSTDASLQGILEQMSKLVVQAAQDATAAQVDVFESANEAARIEKQKALDDAELARTQLALDKADTFEDLADSEAKLEGYIKAKMSAYGASDSSAAIAIMSANTLKFAQARSKAAQRFSLQDKQIITNMNYARLAFANSITSAQAKFNSSVTEINNNTQQALLSLGKEQLLSSAKKDAEITSAKIKFMSDMERIRLDREKAKSQAAQDALNFMKTRIGIQNDSSKMTGTIWDFDAQGNLYDTGELTFSSRIAMAKLRTGTAADTSLSVIQSVIDEQNVQNIPRDEINTQIELMIPSTAQNASLLRAKARQYFNETYAIPNGEFYTAPERDPGVVVVSGVPIGGAPKIQGQD